MVLGSPLNALLDPYGLTLDWKVIQEAGTMQSLDIFINFPIYDININVLHHDQKTVLPLHIERMNAYWGDESWRSVAYEKSHGLFETMEEKFLIVAWPRLFVSGLRQSPDSQEFPSHCLSATAKGLSFTTCSSPRIKVQQRTL